ncbi:hypothetical protein HYX08_03730 [Candidatus Woesearchaeota archaeon]|nr:hypothetical protein [Candidatus Woesearchaeota archaeon]
MRKLTKKAAVFLALSAIGLAFAVYSIKAKNYILLAASILFAAVSADNIFCSLKGGAAKNNQQIK